MATDDFWSNCTYVMVDWMGDQQGVEAHSPSVMML